MTSQCVAGLFCIGSVCQKKPVGTACGGNGECANNNCVDGYCCNSACNGVCQYCGLAASPGICGPAPLGFDPKPADACGAYECNGTATTVCPPASCGDNNNCRSGFTCQSGSCQTCHQTGGVCSQGNQNICCSGVCFSFQCQ
jgi:hypothetical protein